MIYFVEGCYGQIKIGYSKNPLKRILSLQSGSPIPLNLLATQPGGKKDERRLHRQFRTHQAFGEWFRPAPELLAHVEAQKNLRKSSDLLYKPD